MKRKWLFSMAMSLSGLPIIALSFWNLPEFKLPEICLMISGLSLALVAITPGFRYSKLEGFLHSGFAFGSVAFGYGAMILYDPWNVIPTLASALPCYILMKKKVKNYVWWCEVIAFFTIILMLFFKQ
jgi:hypothetical protein